MAVDAATAEDFRLAFRRLASGVALLTYRDREGRAQGMTATAVCSLSAEPAQLLACVDRRGRSRDAIVAAGRFAVNLLGQRHRALSQACARAGGDKSLGAHAGAGWGGVPVVEDALASLVCSLAAVHEQATHSICVGRIVAVRFGPEDRPLVWFDGAYHALARPTSALLPMDELVRALS
jgi:flavin reductase (DIM6/NTAB) family NADH-FMN oxidoreductase RutF